MKEFLVKIERVTKSSGPNRKTNQRGEKYDSYSYDVEISAGDDMFIVSKFIAVDPGKNPDDVINRINIFPGAIGTMKISSSIGDYTKQNGTPGRIERKRIDSFLCYNKREEAEAQRMINNAQEAAVQAQAAQAAAVPPEMPTETVIGDGSGLPF